MTTPPERVAAALRRVAPAARFLAAVCGFVSVAGAVAATLLVVATGAELVTAWPAGTVVTIVVAAVAAAAPAWMWHAAETLRSVADIPDRVESPRPELTIASRDELRAMRTEGIGRSVRTIRTTVREYGDYLGPWQAAIEVATPVFWTWTGLSAVVVAVTALLAPVAALAALVL